MNTSELLRQRRTEAYQQAQLNGTHVLAPRVGSYVFQNAVTKTISSGKQVTIVNALWKSLSDPSFIEGLSFEVATPSFYSAEAIGPKHLTVEELIGRVVIVKEVALINKSLRIQWEVLDSAPVIVQELNFFSMSGRSYNNIEEMNKKYGITDDHYEEEVYDHVPTQDDL